MRGLREQWQEADNKEKDAMDELYDYYREDLDAYIDMTNEIKDAMAKNFEKEIDALSEVNDSINDANAKLVEELQSSVEKYRQDRENERAESDIEDKQRRLAYLQQNPTGNAAEILKLQKEIADDQEAHTDNLIDQKIQDLQDQNDKAAEQREQQIQIMRDQLEYWKNNNANAEIKDALDSAFVNGQLNESSSLVRDMRSAAGYDKMSAEEKEAFDLDLKQRLGIAKTFSAYGANGFEAYLAEWLNDNAYEPPKEPELPKWDSTYKKPKDWGNIRPDHGNSDDIKGLQFALKALKYYDGPIGGTFGNNTQAALKAFQSANGLDPDGKCGPKTREKLKSLFAYKTGGLADFTGPAWLDGTKSRPEYILSADQTQAFFSLVDVLQGLRNGNTQNTQNNGDMAFDIDINVESIGDKIDLDTISQYVEQKIVASANYRNNNLIGHTR